jgi:hypothetical protein
MNRFAKLSMSLMTTISTVKRTCGDKTLDVCSLLNCPRLDAYERALRQTIEVLLQTKNAFKSKELAELRKKLEGVLHRYSTNGIVAA